MEYDLNRFLYAQAGPICGYETALAEMRTGRKRSHWIWYIFPQIAGLAPYPSPFTARYSISCLDEARAYLAHPVLGARLREITSILLSLPDSDPGTVMGSDIDALKLRSSMTLFASVPGADDMFVQVLDRFFGGWASGRMDGKTLEILEREAR